MVVEFYWSPVAPKYSVKRDAAERLRRLDEAFQAAGPRGFILSGSVGEWADPILPLFRLVVLVLAPAAVRAARLRRQEAEEFGAGAIAPGGARHQQHEAFIAWAMAYEHGTEQGRNRARHQTWLKRLTCPVLRLDGTQPPAALVRRISDADPGE